MSKAKRFTLIGLILILLFSLPAASFAAVDKKAELTKYLDTLVKIKKDESIAISSHEKNKYLASSNRQERYKVFANTIVPNYQKYFAGLKAINGISTPELLNLHKRTIDSTRQQLEALTLIKDALSKNKINQASINKANKILAITGPAINKITAELNTYYNKVLDETSKVVNPDKKSGKYSATLTAKEAEKELRNYALIFIGGYADSLKSGSTSYTENFLNQVIASRESGGMGPQKTADGLQERVDDVIKQKGTKGAKNLAALIDNTPTTAFKATSANQTDGTISLTYTLDIPNTSKDIIVFVYLWLQDGQYILESMSLYDPN